MIKKIVMLEATSITYYSEHDENSFFEWLGKISCINRIEGQLETLYIYVDYSSIDQNSLQEIIALFMRYNIPLRQLAAFDKEEFLEWFRNKEKIWYKDIFKT